VDNPLVSIIIPSYGGEKYLEEAIRSVFAQTYRDYELIVVDDGSPFAGVARICRKYEGKVNYVRQENAGQAAARNTAIVKSRGQYVAFLDDDDVWMPEKLEKQVSYYEELEKNGKDVGLIYSGHEHIDERGGLIHRVLLRSSGKNYGALIFMDFVGTPSSVIIKRAVLDDIGLFDEKINNTEDYDLWLRIGRKYEIYSVNEYLIRYRNWRGSASKNAALKIRHHYTLLERVIMAGDENGKPFDEGTQKRLRRRCDHLAAVRWKTAAYEHLYGKSDGKTFREYIRNGYAADRSLFGLKVLVFYLLSFISPALCKAIRKLKKDRAHDIIVNVADLKF